ncbi:chromosome partition protein MukE [Vibrio lentus]|nr:chromosome partition protein MukE [Vibrio lentus]
MIATPEETGKSDMKLVYPALDSMLRSGKHVSIEDLDNYVVFDFEAELAFLTNRYNTELVKAP